MQSMISQLMIPLKKLYIIKALCTQVQSVFVVCLIVSIEPRHYIFSISTENQSKQKQLKNKVESHSSGFLQIAQNSSLHQVLLFGCDDIFPGLHNLGELQIFRKPFHHVRRHLHFFTLHVSSHSLFHTEQKERI